MAAGVSRWYGLEMMDVASAADDALDALPGSPDLAVFRTTSLVAVRWTRRG